MPYVCNSLQMSESQTQLLLNIAENREAHEQMLLQLQRTVDTLEEPQA